MSDESTEYPIIVIGGGIAGATLVETVASLAPQHAVLLLSSSSVIKSVINFKQVTQALEQFEVLEQPLAKLSEAGSNVTVLHRTVSRLDSHQQYKTELVSSFSDAALKKFSEGLFRPVISSVLPFTKVVEAHRLMESNVNAGKIVLEVISSSDKSEL